MNHLIKWILLFPTLLILPGIAYGQNEAGGGFGLEGAIKDMFDFINEVAQEGIYGSDIDELTGGFTSEEELSALSNKSAETGKAGTDFMFSLHSWGETFINVLSPIQLGGVIVAIVSAVMGLVFGIKIGGAFGKHLVIFMIVIFTIAIIFVLIGDSITF